MTNPSMAALNDNATAIDRLDANVNAKNANLSSAVSWSAVFAGAATIVVISLILLILGVGLGLSSVSPWVSRGVTATTFGLSTIIFLVLTQAVASGVGGYLAGRMRVRWLRVHLDEVYFRDTAHGFLAWSVATLAMAVLMTSAISSIVGSGASAGASIVGGALGAASTSATQETGSTRSVIASAGNMLEENIVENLFRGEPSNKSTASDNPAPVGSRESTSATASSAITNAELNQILVRSLRADAMPAADVSYLGRWVSQRTGLSAPEAEKRVIETFGTFRKEAADAEFAARAAADTARKASAKASLWLFVSLLIGAFLASLAAVYGGRQRDHN